MKLILSLILFFTLGLGNNQPKQDSSFKLTTFTNVPDEFGDCGTGYYYLTENDEKKEKLICVTDYAIALIYINNKPIRIKLIEGGSIPGKYSITIKDGPNKEIGDENWTMKSVITIKYGAKIVWRKNLIGFGGC